VIVDFVALSLSHELVDTPRSTLAPLLATTGIEGREPAAAAATIIAGRDRVVELAIIDSLTSFHPDVAASDPLQSLAGIVSRGCDPALAARTFATLARAAARPEDLYPLLAERYQVSLIPGTTNDDEAMAMVIDGEPTLLNAAVTLLAADTDNVITHLATTIDPDGNLTSDFLLRLVSRKHVGDLGLIADSLRGGPEVDPVRFGDIEGYPYSHAANLGYLAGALCNALDRYADRARSVVDGWSLLASAAFFVTGSLLEVTSTAAAAVGSIAEYGATGWIGGKTQANIDSGLSEVKIVVEQALRPDTGIGTSIPGQAWEQWVERLSLIEAPG
jgi:hypothetical protein